MDSLRLSILERNVQIDFPDGAGSQTRDLIAGLYSYFQTAHGNPDLHYSVCAAREASGYIVMRKEKSRFSAATDDELLYLLENDLTIELQKLRRDLYFLHGAALEFSGKVLALIAPSGCGKSTTTWGLLHHGFKYLSDELVPVELDTMSVYPYSHALCLKDEPPAGYPLPKLTLRTSRTRHIPVNLLPHRNGQPLAKLGAVFCVLYASGIPRPELQPITKAEAAARVFSNALNPLAHRGEGLDAAIEIARRNVCFDLTIADLSATCALVRNALESLSND